MAEAKTKNVKNKTKSKAAMKPEANEVAVVEKKSRDLSDMTPAKLVQLQKEYQDYRLKIVTGKEKNTSGLKAYRRDIARAKTFLTNQRTDVRSN